MELEAGQDTLIRRIGHQHFHDAQNFYHSVGYLQPIQTDDIVFAAYSQSTIIGVVRLATEEGHLVLRGMMIAPSHQRRGVGSLMLNELKEYIGANDCFCLPHGWLESFYSQIGFVKVEEQQAPRHLQERLNENRKKYPQLIVMRRPSKTNVRLAVPKDAEGIAKVHVDVWRSTYRGIMPDKVLDELSYEQRAKVRREALEKGDSRYCCLVAEDEKKNIIGFSVGGPRREGNANYDGELYAIYLFKEHHGKGIGKKLFLKTAQWLLQRGHSSMLIWVLKDNPTRKFYEAMGGIPLESKVIEIGAPLDEISYGWNDLKLLWKEMSQ